MRPVLLEMAGFGSFREPTTVDFRGVEYFALVGPTGAGKSTVIDAMTFALYGSVPRWDDRRAVSLALAPTVGRGLVRFVFDVGAARYVAARELRRAGSGAVSVRTARLERLRDPAGTGASEEETEPVADGAAATTRAVEELLGLPFGDFTTCVVLPQGEFAEFLHTEPRKRQETLVRLLGLGVYDVIAKEANSEAKLQEQRAQVLTEQLGGFADATVEAEQAAAARVAELDALRARVATAGGELATAMEARAGAAAAVATLDDERGRLAALAPPDGLAELAARRRAAVEVLAAVEAEAAAAEAADTAAREARDAAPARGPLERAQRDHAELVDVSLALPTARERLDRALADEEAAVKAAATAQEERDRARARRDAARSEQTAAEEVGQRLAAERAALAGVTPPAGLHALTDRASAAAATLAAATAEAARAEQADTAARSALAAAPAREPLVRARRDRRDLDEARAALGAAVAAREEAEAGLAAARERTAAARDRLAHARERVAACGRAEHAAALRPRLAVGAACPVCAQEVSVLPPALPPGDLAAAERALADAEAAHEGAQRVESAAVAHVSRAAATVEAAQSAVDRLATALAAVSLPEPSGAGPTRPGAVPAAAEIDAAIAALDALAEAAGAADAAARRARTARDGAAGEVEAARRATADAAAALRAARDPLVGLGAPTLAEDGDVAQAWADLAGWAAAQVAERDTALAAARAAGAASRAALVAAEDALDDAERSAEQRRRAETAAARAEQEAAGAVARLERRERELAEALRDAPDPAAVSAALVRLDALEEAVRAADVRLRAARTALRSAEQDAAAAERETAGAWAGLRAARDPLVPLGAPPLAADDLGAAWAGLVEWARRESAARVERLAGARAALAAAERERDDVVHRIADDLAAHAVPVARDGRAAATRGEAAAGPAAGDGLSAVPEAGAAAGPMAQDGRPAADTAADPLPIAAAAPAAVATALERARGARERIAERRAAAASLLADRDAAVEVQQIARMLGQLLRSDGFPRWLVASALDTLVADASASLAELSGGQFELTHENGEFLVVDHADADARRPVKTLSGGETFQASLALALALSAQMSGLAAQGAARLESIFLDEGFGTLDEANLESVAATLETLATRGDRVVGVITHVPALAERVPVRFVVRRDQRTSSIERESL